MVNKVVYFNMNNQEKINSFIKEFEKSVIPMVKAAVGLTYSKEIADDRLVIKISHLFSSQITVIEKFYNREYMISVGILENSGLMIIDIKTK